MYPFYSFIYLPIHIYNHKTMTHDITFMDLSHNLSIVYHLFNISLLNGPFFFLSFFLFFPFAQIISISPRLTDELVSYISSVFFSFKIIIEVVVKV